MSCGRTQSPSLHYHSLQTLEVPAPFGGWDNLFRRLVARLLRIYGRQQQRRALRELDDRMLADIGLSREQAEAEARKPLWR
jgi:uncharacterized protein YjiS (DUF1127 family)